MVPSWTKLSTSSQLTIRKIVSVLGNSCKSNSIGSLERSGCLMLQSRKRKKIKQWGIRYTQLDLSYYHSENVKGSSEDSREKIGMMKIGLVFLLRVAHVSAAKAKSKMTAALPSSLFSSSCWFTAYLTTTLNSNLSSICGRSGKPIVTQSLVVSEVKPLSNRGCIRGTSSNDVLAIATSTKRCNSLSLYSSLRLCCYAVPCHAFIQKSWSRPIDRPCKKPIHLRQRGHCACYLSNRYSRVAFLDTVASPAVIHCC